ncbi:MAG TPA: NUDIX hydrolase [Oscillospiraceae bacterium]|nr:NUDIX hydrolase [Oscillospiraceae bacterium]
MDLTERRLDHAVVYEGHLVRVEFDHVLVPNGRTSQREVVRHPGGVAVVPLDEDGNVVTVTQYRYPIAGTLLEIPAGKREEDEEPRLCALRELEEETGLIPGKLTDLGSIFPSPGYCDEELHLYLAQELTQGKAHPDPDEILRLRRIPLRELVDMALRNELRDAKTVAAVLKTSLLLRR